MEALGYVLMYTAFIFRFRQTKKFSKKKTVFTLKFALKLNALFSSSTGVVCHGRA